MTTLNTVSPEYKNNGQQLHELYCAVCGKTLDKCTCHMTKAMVKHSWASEILNDKQAVVEIAIGSIMLLLVELTSLVPVQYQVYAYLVAYLILGHEVIGEALEHLFKGHALDENFLMTVATVGAFGIHAYGEAVGVMLFYRLGEYMEDLAVEKSRKEIIQAADLRPETVNLLDGQRVKVIPAGDARVGDIILVRPGERIPLDSIVQEGRSFIDTAPVTGEPLPVATEPGKQVMSGCINKQGMLKLQVEKVLAESMVSKILRSVESAAASKPQMERFITRFAKIYTPFVVGLAVLTAVVPSVITGNWQYWIYTALTFLVISCPCALVLSVPLAYFAGIGAGSKQGILFKGGIVMEALKKIKVVSMDKTGTITKGNFQVQKIEPAAGVTEKNLLTKCAGAELISTHPLAQSIVKMAKEKGLVLDRPKDFTEVPGEGIKAIYLGEEVLCGNELLLKENSVAYTPVKERDQVGGTKILVAVNGKYWGKLIIDDTIKDGADTTIAKLKAKGLETALLTGDSKENAERISSKVGIEQVYGQLLPQDKFQVLQKLRKKFGPIMYVGDGINDAPVLAGADVGAAMGSGADAALEAADVVFLHSDIESVNKAISIGTTANKVALENVYFALGVKLVILLVGMFGYASMWAAVFADSGVAALCVVNSIRIIYKKF
jgi:Cd2+/Zn2+-exporting ATPase